jgi:D-beta-D-heptose 7-phosphate kinase/D-beta-D-heptose 1-phosphate adenosyltransferase
LNNQDDRAVVLAALAMVDVVVMFDQDTPRELISHLKPDVLVKGGDYHIEDIAGYHEVRSWGGEVKVIPFRTGCSTSSLYERIRNLPKE